MAAGCSSCRWPDFGKADVCLRRWTLKVLQLRERRGDCDRLKLSSLVEHDRPKNVELRNVFRRVSPKSDYYFAVLWISTTLHCASIVAMDSEMCQGLPCFGSATHDQSITCRNKNLSFAVFRLPHEYSHVGSCPVRFESRRAPAWC